MSRDAEISNTEPELLERGEIGRALDSETLERYWRGETPPQLTAAIDRWLREEPQRWDRYEALRQSLAAHPIPGYSREEKSRRVDSVISAALAMNRLYTRPALGDTPIVHDLAVVKPRWNVLRTGWSAMTALIVVIAIWGGGWFSSVHRVNSRLSSSRSIYATGNGERARVTLTDGSTVVLNVGSRLEVPANYGIDNRNVYLVGEALFTVAHQTSAPFQVSTGTSTTRVLGTTFAVRQYASDSAARIAVRDGRVSVQSTVLSADQEVMASENGVSTVSRANPGYFTFAQGVLTLDDVRLDDAISDLNRWYNADIRLGDSSLDARLVGGRFGTGSLTDLVEYLEWTFNLRVERDGRRLTLYKKS